MLLLSLAFSTGLQAGNDYKRLDKLEVADLHPAELLPIAPIAAPAIIAPLPPAPLTLVDKAEIVGYMAGAVSVFGGMMLILVKIALEDAL